MYGMKVATTREVIEKLQSYEKENGIGAIVSIATHMAGDRENEFRQKYFARYNRCIFIRRY